MDSRRQSIASPSDRGRSGSQSSATTPMTSPYIGPMVSHFSPFDDAELEVTQVGARDDDRGQSPLEWSENPFKDVGGTPLTRRRPLTREGSVARGDRTHSRTSSSAGSSVRGRHSRGSSADSGSVVPALSSDTLFDDYEPALSDKSGGERQDFGSERSPLISPESSGGASGGGAFEYGAAGGAGPTGFATLFGVRQLLLLYVSVFALSAVCLGYDLGVISVAKDKAGEDLGLDSWQIEWMVGALNFASAAGALFTGPVSDHYGRRQCLLIAGALQALGSVIMAFSNDFVTLVSGRVIAGLGVGSALMCGPLYTAELSPQRLRGALVTVTEVAINVGIVAGYLVGYTLIDAPMDTGWRWMLGLGTAPAVVVMACVVLMPESPRWLMDKNRVDEAEEILLTVCTAEECEMAIFAMQRERDLAMKGSVLLFLRCPREWRRMLLVGIATATFAQACGIEAVIVYMPQLLSESLKNEQADSVYLIAIVIGVVKTAVVAFAVLIVDKRSGRRPMLLASGVGMALCMLGVGLSSHFADEDQPSIEIIVLLSCFMASHSLGYGPVGWVLVSEVFPLQVRGVAVGTATFLNRLVAGAAAATFLTLDDQLKRSGIAFLYASISVLAFCFTFFFVPETKGKSLEEIEDCMREAGFCTGRDRHGFALPRRTRSLSGSSLTG